MDEQYELKEILQQNRLNSARMPLIVGEDNNEIESSYYSVIKKQITFSNNSKRAEKTKSNQ